MGHGDHEARRYGSRVYHKSAEFGTWGEPAYLKTTVEAREDEECAFSDVAESQQRREFCLQHDGYGALCSCDAPLVLPSPDTARANKRLKKVPVVVVAGENRPQYLFRALVSLLSAEGVHKNNIVVYIDGTTNPEPEAVCRLLGVRSVQHTPRGEKNGRIAQHYRDTLVNVFDLFPAAEYVIINEEDLDVAPDYFSYFAQTMPLMKLDPTIYCISAWNDQGYEGSSYDPALLYRVETMPGLGWLLSRALFKNELEAAWPKEGRFDWDMWMRMPDQRKGRECVIPDVSRTYHFGASGVNMSPYFQSLYFERHRLNKQPRVILRDTHLLTAKAYDKELHRLLSSALVVNHAQDPCSKQFLQSEVAVADEDTVFVMYIVMTSAYDYKNWQHVAKCWKLWDLDVRGFHKSLWRTWRLRRKLFVVGTTSEFAQHKPSDVVPYDFKQDDKEKDQADKKDH
eukprot:m.195149 g.195149  ORF g.195149 m.195149 type:complete len:454 (+) comp21806_c0_seq2:515-1876(+)